MKMRNSGQAYGVVSQALHWGMAIVAICLFGLGLWMTSLTYYDVWYTRGPYLHEGFGILLAAGLVFRIFWRIGSVTPDTAYLSNTERLVSLVVHWSLYTLLAVAMVSGYLISTVDGHPINVFDWFSVPSFFKAKGLEEQAGAIHFYASIIMIALAALHTLAALKHHFLDRDQTLTRMLPFQKTPQTTEQDTTT